MPSLKTKLNFTNDLILFLCMMLIIGIGFIMNWVLPTGREVREVYGRGVELTLWGWDRHEWGELHFILGLVFLALLMLHLFLHWSFIKGTFRSYIKNKWLRITVTVIFLCVGLGSLSSWIMKPKVHKPSQGYEMDHEDEHSDSHLYQRKGRGEGRGRSRR